MGARHLGPLAVLMLSCVDPHATDGAAAPSGSSALERLRAVPVLGPRVDRASALVAAKSGFVARDAGAITANIPSTARGHLRVLRDANRYLDIVAEHESDARGVVEANAMVYRDASRDTDAFVLAEPDRIEEIRVLRSAAAPTVARWRVDLGPGLASLRAHEGVIEALDARGRAWLRTDPIFAVDAVGRRVVPSVTVSKVAGAFVIETALDVTGLEYPVALDPGWGPTNAMSVPRNFHGSVALTDGRILVFGGGLSSATVGGPTSHSSAEIYDPPTGTWTATDSMSVARSRAGAFRLPDGKVMVLGGIGNTTIAAGCAAHTTSEIWDPTNGTWSPGTPLPKAWGGNNAHALPGNKFFIASGSAACNGGIHTNAHVLDVATSTWSNSTNTFSALGPPSVVLQSGKVLLAGGQNGTSTTPVSTVNIFDPATMAFTLTGSLGVARKEHALTLLPSGRVLAAGGTSGAGYESSVEIYDPATATWSAAAPMAKPRATSPKAVMLTTGKLLIATGFATVAASDAELYDPVANAWSPAGRLSGVRLGYDLFQLPAGAAVAIGGYFGTTVTATSELMADSVVTGATCASAGACASGFCADGVCCDVACTGKCQTCSAVGSVGTCTSLPAPPAGKGVCDPYVCGAVDCKTTCAMDTDCIATSYCNTTTSLCAPRLDQGAACTAASACKSGFCVDGACCNSACNGACEGCAESGSVGVCVAQPPAVCGGDTGVDAAIVDTGSPAVDTGTEPADTSAPPTDTGTAPATDIGVAGSSTKLPELPQVSSEFTRCKKNAECSTGHCVEGVCCDTACEDKCHSCALITSPGRCTLAPIGVDLRNECGPALQCLGTCDGAGACIGAGNGTMCARNRCTSQGGGVGPAYCPGPGGKCDTEAVAPFDCSPYVCEPAFGACRTACASSLDCVNGFVCDIGSKICIQPPPPADEGGCAITTARPDGALPGSAMLVALLALGTMGRRRITSPR